MLVSLRPGFARDNEREREKERKKNMVNEAKKRTPVTGTKRKIEIGRREQQERTRKGKVQRDRVWSSFHYQRAHLDNNASLCTVHRYVSFYVSLIRMHVRLHCCQPNPLYLEEFLPDTESIVQSIAKFRKIRLPLRRKFDALD